MNLRIISLLLFLTSFASMAWAHPVAQGTVEIDVRREEVRAEFRVSNEEVFVAGTFGAGAGRAKNLEGLWKEHGSYLLDHVRVEADGVVLRGEVVEVRMPEDKTTNGFAAYVLRFPLSSPAPRAVQVREDLLNEIEFAPGNPWEATFAARIKQEGRTIEEARLLSRKQPVEIKPMWSTAEEFAVTPTFHLGRLVGDFFIHGVEHITGGWDHALFVAALVFAVGRFWQVIALVTAFTVAHTITLTLAVLRLAHLPRGIVEPMIAISIIVAALLNFTARKEARLSSRMVVAFGFGLFHGLGFASGLVQAMSGFTTAAVAASVAGFSVGVEVGHQLVVVPLVLGMMLVRRWASGAVLVTLRTGSAVVAAAGVYLLVLSIR